jgi:cytosine/adenosine deaminase-related metal-dependent hydrolase
MLLNALLLLAVQNAPAPADTTRFTVLNHGRPAGEMLVTRAGETVTVRYAHVDRNRGRWLENRYRLGPDGPVLMAESRPMTRSGQVGDPNERFEVLDGVAQWTRGGGGSAPADAGTFFMLSSGTAFDDALLARTLLRSRDGTLRLLPTGSARVEIVTDTVVQGAAGPLRVRYAALHGTGGVPGGVWLDERDELVAGSVAWFITVRPDAVPALDTLRDIEIAWRDARTEAMAAELLRAATPAGPVVIRNGDVFDSERGVLLPRHTVVIEGDRIVAVGPAGSVVEPAGARVIDATGRTVMPGMWDMHVHLQLGTQALGGRTMLAAGLTTVRDLAADLDVAVSYRDRVDAGRLVGPRVLLGGFIEGPGEWAGPSEAIAANEEEARAWVRRYASLGYRQIKLYNLVHPDFVPAIAEETRRHGMRLSGHVPRGLSVPAAVRLGFDEINHAAFLFSTFFQDSLYVPEMRPYSGVAGAVAPGFDVDSQAMTELIALLRERGTVIDGTFSLWMGANAPQGRGSPAAASYARLLKRLHDAGVTLVAGTDNTTGSTFVTELEMFEFAGVPAAEVLQIATIVPARVMGEDAEYGSVAVGKVADVLIIDGKPLERIAELRRIEYVIRAGKVFTPEELRARR